jgi:putative endopeptidase
LKTLILCAGSLLISLVSSPSFAADAVAKPQFGPWGFDLAGARLDANPGDDFFNYANGGWIERTQIPSDKAVYSLRAAMSDLTEARLHDLMEQAAAQPRTPATLTGQMGAFYRSFMDAARVEALGARAIAPQIAAVKRAATRDQLAGLMGRSNIDFESSLFSLFIKVDLKDPTRYALHLRQSGLGMPDRDYYLEPRFAPQRAAYQRYVAQMLTQLNWEAPEASARDVLAFETAIAQHSWTKVQQRDLAASYNPMSIEELRQLAPGFGWRSFFDNAKVPKVNGVIVAEKSAFPKLSALYSATPEATLRAWHAFHIADNAAPYLASAFTDAYFTMNKKVLQGQQEQQVRWKRAITAVAGGDFLVGERFGTFGTMGFGVGQLYTATYFPPAVKTQVEAMIANLKAAFRARLEQLDWMDAATRREALAKLDTYTIKVGYPDRPRSYAGLAMRADDLVGNVRRAAEFDWAFYAGRLGGAVDKADWRMTPQTNNAYNGSLRDIVFPAGILQAPIFDPNADPAINYGAAGAVIGHELIHGFDDQGRTIDAAGALRDWWSAKDAATFKARADMLGAQYAEYEPVAGAKVNGGLTMGENIADLGGITLALDAYRASLQGRAAPVLDGFTGDQRVLLGWAQAWRGKSTDAALKKQVVSDPHAPRMFRVDGPMRNIDDWYDAFHVKPGDARYLAPQDRARIW